MKKRYILIAIMFIFSLLAACSNDSDDAVETDEVNEETAETEAVADAEEETEDGGAIEVDRGLFNVELTLPASFVGTDEEAEAIIAEAKDEDGISEVTKNEDGSLTYKMTRGKHKEMMEEFKTDITQTMEEIETDEEVASIQKVTANKSFSEFTLIVDQAAYENSFDGFATLTLGMSGLMYQVFDGVSEDDFEVLIHLEDATTGELFSTIEYPEVFDEIDEIEETE